MDIQHPLYTLSLDDTTGAIQTLKRGHHILFQQHTIPLFSFSLSTPGQPDRTISSHEAESLRWEQQQHHEAHTLLLTYERVAHLPLTVRVKIRIVPERGLTYWSMEMSNETDSVIEWIDFPHVTVANDLIAAGGDSSILWPGCEGLLITDAHKREGTWMAAQPLQYPSRGWEGFYPGCCQSQCMAYYNQQGGVYLAAHDASGCPKMIEYRLQEERIALQFRLFPGALGRGTWAMGYEMVLGVFEGDWYDAAALYREWYEQTHERPALSGRASQWYHRYPVVVIYPIRGEKDTGEMAPNAYFPYERALPVLNHLAEAFDAPLLALLMHWEGTAPWAPPYIWPPFGGEALLTSFIKLMHRQGHLVGLYGSGIGWTQESLLVPYERREQFEQEHLDRFMCRGPQGELPYSLICGGSQRWGYDLCAATPFAKEVTAQEIARVAATGCDYLQYFDQQIGGTPYFCYDSRHGHPPAPGRWMVEEMLHLYAQAKVAAGEHLILGCEAGAAEPYQEALPINDLRSHMGLLFGESVPLYAYLYHGRVANFLGNQVNLGGIIDLVTSPDVVRQQLASAFVAGDLLSVTLNRRGELHWGWGTSWDIAPPEQASLLQLINTFIQWRRFAAAEWLEWGIMLKPRAIMTGTIILQRQDGSHIPLASIATSRWQAPAGQVAQILVNYLTDRQQVTIDFADMPGKEVLLLEAPQGEQKRRSHIAKTTGRLSLEMGPLSVVAVVEE